MAENKEEEFNLEEYESEILKELEQRENYKNSFKDIHITDKQEALKFLKEKDSADGLFYAYAYSLDDSIKSDDEIYEYLKQRFMFNRDSLFRDYSRSFVHEYGEACGKTNDKSKIDAALKEIKRFIDEENYYYGYWMFYSLHWATPLEFETFLEIYKLFEPEKSIQGFLLQQYRDVFKEKATHGEMIRLLDASTDECVQYNWFMAVNNYFFSMDLYNVLLRRGVDKQKLDQRYEQYQKYETKRREEKFKDQDKEANVVKKKKWWKKGKH